MCLFFFFVLLWRQELWNVEAATRLYVTIPLKAKTIKNSTFPSPCAEAIYYQ